MLRHHMGFTSNSLGSSLCSCSTVAQLFEQLTGLVYQILLNLTGFTNCE